MAATFVVPSDRDMIRRSHAIAVGEALGSYTRLTEHGSIVTVTTFSVTETIKGSFSKSTIEIVEPGGIYGNQGRTIAGVPRFTQGEKALLFLRGSKDQYGVTDIALGRFTLLSDVMGQKLAIREESAIIGWDPDGSIHKEQRRDAAKFLQFIRTEVNGGIGREDYFVSSYPLSTQALVVAPARLTPAPTLSPTGKTAKSYGSSGDGTNAGTGSRWFDMPTAHQFYVATISTALTPETAGSTTILSGAPANGVTAITTSLANWNNDSQSNVNYVFNAGAAPCGANCKGLHSGDGSNTITFEADLNTLDFGNIPAFAACAGTIGIGGPSFNIVNTAGPDGDNFYPNTEADVEFNRGVNACVAFVTSGNLITGLTHEIGHTLGFRHSDQTRANNPGVLCATDATLECDSTTAVMKAVIVNGISGVLSSWDQNAVRTTYPCSLGGGCTKANADFNGDGKSDVIWRNSTTGDDALWQMNGVTINSPVLLPQIPDANWKMAGVGDFDGDGKADVLWHHIITGQVVVWLMNGTVLGSAGTVTTLSDTNFRVVGVGDTNADGKADVIWRNQVTGQVVVWLMNGLSISTAGITSTVADLNFTVVGVGDFNADGKADLFWRNSATGANVIYLMNGTAIQSAAATNTVGTLTYKVVGVGDTNSDGKADVFWWNSANGDTVLWQMNGTTVQTGAFITTVSDINWHVEAVGDFNGDGKADLMWRKVTTGEVAGWLMNGTTIQTPAIITTVSDLNWSMVAPR